MTRRVPYAQPDEVAQFVYEDAREFGASAIEGDAAFAEKSSGVDGTAMVADAGRGLDTDGGARKRGQTAKNGLRAHLQGTVFEQEKI